MSDAPATATTTAEPAAAAPVTETNPAPAAEGAEQKPIPSMLGDTPTEEAPKQEPAPEPVPEKYEAFKDSEGNSYDPEQVADFAAVAKELGLSQEKAQKMFGVMRPAADKYVREEHMKRVEGWVKASQEDKEFGGSGFKANLGVAAKAYKEFATPELRQLLDQSGLGNHPEMIRLFYRIGQKVSQDTGVTGAGAPEPKRRMFPNSNMNL